MRRLPTIIIDFSELLSSEASPEEKFLCAILERAWMDLEILMRGGALSGSGGGISEERRGRKYVRCSAPANDLKCLVTWFKTKEPLGFHWICEMLPAGEALKEKFQNELFSRFPVLNVSGTYAEDVIGKLDQSLRRKNRGLEN